MLLNLQGDEAGRTGLGRTAHTFVNPSDRNNTAAMDYMSAHASALPRKAAGPPRERPTVRSTLVLMMF